MAHQRRYRSKRELFWRDAMARFGGSGLTVRAFCVREGLSEPSFYAWRRTLRQRDTLYRSPGVPAFVPVTVKDGFPATESAGVGFSIELRGGRVLRLPATLPARQVAELVHAIEAAPTSAETPA